MDLGILTSGRGSNLGAILRALRAKRRAADVSAPAAGLWQAPNDDVATAVLAPSSFPVRERARPLAAVDRRHPLAFEQPARGELRIAGHRVLGGLP